MDTIGIIQATLLSMAQKARQTNERNYRDFLDEFDTILVGDKMNMVLSLEVYHFVREKNDIDISLNEFTKLIPTACDSLGMKYEGLVALADIGKSVPKIATYYISLF